MNWNTENEYRTMSDDEQDAELTEICKVLRGEGDEAVVSEANETDLREQAEFLAKLRGVDLNHYL